MKITLAKWGIVRKQKMEILSGRMEDGMFIFTAKLDKKKAVAAVLGLAVILCVIILIAGALSRGSGSTSSTVSSNNLRTNEDMVLYLKELGWEVEPEPLERQEIVIPREFSGVYSKYAELQKEQGFELEKYGGQSAVRYTYKITNYPTEDRGVVADLIIFGTTLIAGDIQSTAIDGFMHGLFERV